MHSDRVVGWLGKVWRSAAGVAVLLSGVALAAGGGSPAQAATRGVHPAVDGFISTFAGGVGGPALATKVALAIPVAVSYGGGALYVGGGPAVRMVDPLSGQLTTPAGNGDLGSAGSGGPATQAKVDTPYAEAVDSAGNLVIADTDNNRIRVVAASTATFYGKKMTAGDIYSVAGGGTAGLGDGGPATSAELGQPQGLAVDAAGNLVIADTSDNRVRVVAAATGTFYGQAMTAGDIYTVAGNGGIGFSGDGGPATSAVLNQPRGMVVDAAGNLVFSDTGNDRVRVVAAATGTFYGQAMTAGDIYTVAGTISSRFHGGDGGPATSAGLGQPEGVALDAAGNLLIADYGHSRIRVVAATTGTFYGQAMTADDIYTVAGDAHRGFAGDGGPATSASLHNPGSVAVDGAGNLVIGDTKNYRVRVVAAATGTFYGQAMTAGNIYTVAGNGHPNASGVQGPATAAEFSYAPGSDPGVAVDGAGNLVFTATGNSRVQVVAATTARFYGQAMTAGDLYTVAGDGKGFSGDGGPATSAKLEQPSGIAVDAAGNLVIADTLNNRIRVVAASSGTFYGVAMTARDIYTVAGDGTEGFSGDGGQATSAELFTPTGVTVDAAGNLVISDTYNQRIRVVAATTGTFYGQAMTAGDIYTVAGDASSCGFSGDGGPAASAQLCYPDSVAVDAAGDLVIADTLNGRVRVVAAATGTFYGQAMTAGDIYTVAGGGTSGLGDGGPATSAELNGPQSVAVDAAGDLVISDTGNDAVRVVPAATGTFYGVSMTAGDIYTVAGNGTQGLSGDGGPGTSAELHTPGGVALDAGGDIMIADTGNNRIREVTS